MNHLNEIKAYWNKRAEGYSISNKESLKSDEKQQYEEFLKSILKLIRN